MFLFSQWSPSAVDNILVRCQPSHRCHPCCCPPLSMPLLSAIDTHVIVAHILAHVILCHRRRHCRHSHRFRRTCCRFLVDCCMYNSRPPLSCSSCHLMMSSSHHGRLRQMTPTPAEPMPGGHWARWHIPVFVPVCWGAGIQDRIPVPAGIWRNPAATSLMFRLFYGPEPYFHSGPDVFYTCFTYNAHIRSNVCLPVKH